MMRIYHIHPTDATYFYLRLGKNQTELLRTELCTLLISAFTNRKMFQGALRHNGKDISALGHVFRHVKWRPVTLCVGGELYKLTINTRQVYIVTRNMPYHSSYVALIVHLRLW